MVCGDGGQAFGVKWNLHPVQLSYLSSGDPRHFVSGKNEVSCLIGVLGVSRTTLSFSDVLGGLIQLRKTVKLVVTVRYSRRTEIKISKGGTLEVAAQWLRIRLSVQGTRVRAVVQEDPTCGRATEPVRRNY